MRRLAILLAASLLMAAADRRPTPEPPVPPVGVTLTAAATLECCARSCRAPSRRSSWRDAPTRTSTWCSSSARRDPGDTVSLVRVSLDETAGAESLRPLLRDLPVGALGALDVDGDGAEDLLLAADGALHSLGPAAAPHAPAQVLDLAETEEVLLPSRWAGRELGGVAVASVGRARLFVPRDTRFDAALDRELPTHAVRVARGIVLSSPRLLGLGGASARLAAGPEPVGRQRLRTLLFDASATSEAWSLLPGPEVVDAVGYASLDGRPVMVVVTINAGRIGIFEKKKLRVFALESDRTQAGHAPVLAVLTTSHRWLPVTTTIVDVDRDGHDDLIALQPEGMGGGELVVETFFGRGEGRLTAPGRRQKLEVRSEASIYGHDLTGDGVADLAVLDGDDALLVFAGTGDPRRALLERQPLVTTALGELGSSIRALRCADLDADGTSEAILVGGASPLRDLVLVVAIAPKSRPAPARDRR